MPKLKTTFFCQNCGAQSSKWIGKCPSCSEWNTYVEEVIEKPSAVGPGYLEREKGNLPVALDQISSGSEARMSSRDSEFDRVLGGGLVPGSVILIGGEPGIGKSTLMLQLVLRLQKIKTLYISGEESLEQIRMRAQRIGLKNPDCLFYTETQTHFISQQLTAIEPGLVIIDSIQTLSSPYLEAAAGSISQIRQCAAELIRFAKETSTPFILIGHITKEGQIAGPKILEHMVDTVLQFEGDQHHIYRILRTTKNRFGSTAELGIYEMHSGGLREVANPSEILIPQREDDLSGVAIGATLEGNRPLLIEVQALVGSAAYGTPQRSTTGYDAKRLNMLLAVLEKRGGLRLGNLDVFLNIAGGLKIADPAIDLAVCVAIISSMKDLPVPVKWCFSAEVGLGGEVRSVNRIENRIAEAEKLGFEKIFVSRYNLKGIDISRYKIKVEKVGKLSDLLHFLN
jgi:DNA repair protein RadA/Sms